MRPHCPPIAPADLSHRTRAWLGFAGCCLLFGLTACDAPVVGNWRSVSKMGNGQRNELSVSGDYTGEAKIHAASVQAPDTWTTLRFELTWGATEDGEDYEFDLECDKGVCTKADEFDMVCKGIQLDSGEERLDCSGEKLWRDYPFNWERSPDE